MHRFFRWFGTISVVLGGTTLLIPRPAAQVAQLPAAVIPRLPDGKPNLSGIWQVMNSANGNILDHSAELGVPAGLSVVEGGVLPYQPVAAAKQKENYANRAALDPENQCYLPGIPRATYMPFPFEIVQGSTDIAFLYEYAHAARIVHVKEQQHPDGIFPWMGDSRGRWDGDSLVIDVTNFDERTWFDRAGNFHSDELHVIERYTIVDANLINYEATIEDPKVFTRPWKMTMPIYRHRDPHKTLLEYECYAYAEEALQKGAGAASRKH